MSTEKLKLKLDDPHTREVWQAVQRAKTEVAAWPAWKRGGVNDTARMDNAGGHRVKDVRLRALTCALCGNGRHPDLLVTDGPRSGRFALCRFSEGCDQRIALAAVEVRSSWSFP